MLGRGSRALLRDVITPRQSRQFPGEAESCVLPWGLGSVSCFLVGCLFDVVAGLVPHLGEVECWFVGARSVVQLGRGRRAG